MKKRNDELLTTILKEISSGNNITQKNLAKKYNRSERSIRRYFKILKDSDIIFLEQNGKLKKWKTKKLQQK